MWCDVIWNLNINETLNTIYIEYHHIKHFVFWGIIINHLHVNQVFINFINHGKHKFQQQFRDYLIC